MAKMNKNANYVTEKRQLANQASAKAKSSKKTKGVAKNVLLIVAIVLVAAALIAGFVFWMIGISNPDKREFLNPYEGHFEVTDVVELEFEGYGKVKVELYGKEAPKTVENFLHLVEHGEITAEKIAVASSTSDQFITVSMTHDHEEEGHEHTYIKGEFYDNGVANRIQHVSGVLTMSNGSTKYNSSSTDFKIITNALNKNYNTEKSSGYNGNYAAFGKVDAEGLEVVRKIVEDYREKADATTDKNALAFGSNNISITASDIENKTIEKTFTPTNSGTYVFKSTKYTSIILDVAKEGAKASEFGKEYTTLKDGVSYDLVAGQEYTVTLGLGELKAGSHLLTISGDLLLDGTNKISITSSDITNKTIEKTFTPTNSAKYIFKSDKYASIILDMVKDGAKASEFGKEYTTLKDGVSYDLVAGQEYTVTLGLGDLKVGTHNITIEDNLLTDGTNNIEITEEDIKNESISYIFIPEYTGTHLFDCLATDNDKTFKGEFEIFDGETSVGEKSAYLEKGKTYTFIIKTKENVEADDYKVVISAPTLVTGDNALSIPEYTIRDGKAYYYFTPSEDAKYLLSNKDLTIKVYDSEGNVVAGGNYVELKKDVTYKIEISADLDPLMGLGDTAIAITADDKKGDADYKKDYSFTAEATGKYTFAGDNVTFEIWNGAKKVAAESDGTYSLKVGTTYTVTVKAIAEGNYSVNVKVDDPKDEDDVIVYASYTLKVQTPKLVVGSNKLTIDESDVTAKNVEYSFTATTNGMFSFTGIYQKLDENGEQMKDKEDNLINVNAKITLKDKDGNELNVENAKLVKGETYTVILKSDLIRKDAVATITVAKVAPKIVKATIVEK
ncbi:MAG: peptidylprolyl isomerase [Clostridia bacterium]|nr:peptidylprolyl isomerase [Clostridia bacterium]